MKKTVAWIVPPLLNGGGGSRTIIENANYLSINGWKSDIYIDIPKKKNKNLKEEIIKAFGKCECDIYYLDSLDSDYEVMIATYSIHTPEIVYHSNAKHKLYFIQDFEPWFEPMGDLFLERENSYKLGLKGISIGKWLNHKIHYDYSMKMDYFPFCANLNIYKPLNIKKENAICFIYQPDKPRRCDNLGINALRIVKKLRPDVTIYFYGSSQNEQLDFPIINLHLLSIEECNQLYNRCSVGLCISASNPSRIPFEMMASGLPVVDIYRENNLYDYPNDAILLSSSTADAIAASIIYILDNPDVQKSMSSKGIDFMSNYPIEKGFQTFLAYMNSLDDNHHFQNVEHLYKKRPYEYSLETKECLNNIFYSNQIKISENVFGKITIDVINPFSVFEIKSLILAKWSEDNQSDLEWIPFSKSNNKYTILLKKKHLKQKNIFHIYVKDIYDNMYNIIQTEFKKQ